MSKAPLGIKFECVPCEIGFVESIEVSRTVPHYVVPQYYCVQCQRIFEVELIYLSTRSVSE